MSRTALVACVQPPYLDGSGKLSPQQIMDEGLALLQRAGERGADIACLPEYFNAMNATPQEGARLIQTVPGPLTERVGEIAQANGMHVVLPMAELRGQRVYNSATTIGAEGEIVGVA
ncbi:MAG TPA: carbon-nitrogen hydrolase family protein, partial [Armatimonadota bacterium]|nr:carbon-nitrogen hydrolase family protein [Armatimonadota bacterium]